MLGIRVQTGTVMIVFRERGTMTGRVQHINASILAAIRTALEASGVVFVSRGRRGRGGTAAEAGR
jgi:hypothetical protein